MKKENHRGFTLIELLVVISIIGLLSSVVLASLNTARAKARDARRKLDLQQLVRVNELYYNEEGNGTYIPLTGYFSNTVQYGWTNPAFNPVIPKYISSLTNDPLYPSVSGYSYLTKDWSTCANATTGFSPDSQRYAFYAILESPSASDLATMNDAFDQCQIDNWGFNYKVGN